MGRPLRNHVVVPDSEVPGGRRSISRYLTSNGKNQNKSVNTLETGEHFGIADE